VLVDDLDRCLPETAIETLEAIRLFVFTKNTAFVVGADEAMIEYAVRKHFPDLPDTTGPRDYARNYLEKLIQVPFRIPALGETETRIYVTLLLIGAQVGEDDPGFQNLIVEGRERLKRPWQSRPIDPKALNSTLGDKAQAAQEMLALSDQVGPLLANGSKGNPRQIKRFINALLLRKSIAEARGFGDEVRLPILAKLMLAERFLDVLFDQIAMSATGSPDGKCKEMGLFETAIDERTVKKSADGVKKTKEPENSLVAGWLGSEIYVSWASLQPKLADVDLRPYLFVAKDKKDYFGASSALGKLGDVVDRLMGGKLAVQSIAKEIQVLAPPEASMIFEQLRTSILSKDSYFTKPTGIDGMVALVSAHSHLEGDLLDFLDALPVAKTGAWAAGGWDSCIKDGASRARLRKILEGWAESSSSSQALKQAAKFAGTRT
jgi:predicted KAP-like P-loop ATPase